MKMKLTLIIAATFILISSCGFKVLDKTILNKFEINEINSVGDKRINFLIKNNVSKLINSKNAEELIDLDLEEEDLEEADSSQLQSHTNNRIYSASFPNRRNRSTIRL